MCSRRHHGYIGSVLTKLLQRGPRSYWLGQHLFLRIGLSVTRTQPSERPTGCGVERSGATTRFCILLRRTRPLGDINPQLTGHLNATTMLARLSKQVGVKRFLFLLPAACTARPVLKCLTKCFFQSRDALRRVKVLPSGADNPRGFKFGPVFLRNTTVWVSPFMHFDVVLNNLAWATQRDACGFNRMA